MCQRTSMGFIRMDSVTKDEKGAGFIDVKQGVLAPYLLPDLMSLCKESTPRRRRFDFPHQRSCRFRLWHRLSLGHHAVSLTSSPLSLYSQSTIKNTDPSSLRERFCRTRPLGVLK